MDPIHVNGGSSIHSKRNVEHACDNVKPSAVVAPCSHWKLDESTTKRLPQFRNYALSNEPPILKDYSLPVGKTSNSLFYDCNVRKRSEFNEGSTQASGFIPGYQGFIPCQPSSEEARAYVDRSRKWIGSSPDDISCCKPMPGYTGHRRGRVS